MERLFSKFTISAVMALFLTLSAHASNKEILKAMEENDMQDFKKLMSAEEKINAKDANGKTLLHYAAWFNRPEMAAFLLERGAKIDAVDIKGDTPLTLAASKNFRKMCDFLVSKGANEKAENSFGEDYTELLKKFDTTTKEPNSRITEKDVAAQNVAVAAVYETEAKRIDQSGSIVNPDGYYLFGGEYINKTRNKSVKFDSDPETGKNRFTVTLKQEDGTPEMVSGTYELEGDCIYMHAKNQNDMKLKVMKSNLLFEPRTGAYYSLDMPRQTTSASAAKQSQPSSSPAPANGSNVTPVSAQLPVSGGASVSGNSTK